MNKVLYLSIIIANLILLNGCAGERISNSNKPENKSLIAINTANTNSQTIENGSVVNPPVVFDGNTNSVQSNTATNLNTNINKGKIVESNSNERPKTSLLPAPHNSSVGMTMGAGGEFIEIRIFNSDAQIQKMEKNSTTKKIKVFLKNGKVLDVPAGNNLDFGNASPQEILIALGIVKKPDESQTGGR